MLYLIEVSLKHLILILVELLGNFLTYFCFYFLLLVFYVNDEPMIENKNK